MDSGARSRNVQLILNGKAAGNDALQTAVERQRAAGHSIEVRVTSEKGDAASYIIGASLAVDGGMTAG